MKPKQRKKKALIYETQSCHQEIIPSWVWALQQLGYHVDIITGAKGHRQITRVMTSMMSPPLTSFRVLPPQAPSTHSARACTSRLDAPAECDVIINNSLYPNDKSKSGGNRFAAATPATNTATQPLVFSVLHRLPRASRPTESLGAAFFQKGHVTIALGPHIRNNLQSKGIRSVLCMPVFFGDLPDISEDHTSVQPAAATKIVVQGTLERFRRNYDDIPKVINALTAPPHPPAPPQGQPPHPPAPPQGQPPHPPAPPQGQRRAPPAAPPPLTFHLLGDGPGAEGLLRSLRSKLHPAAKTVASTVITAHCAAGYKEFFTTLRAAHFVMPLVDHSFEHEYFTGKITSSVMMAVGNGVPLILHKDLAQIYGLRDQIDCFTYAEGEAAGAVQRALRQSGADRLLMLQAVRETRKVWLETMLTELKGVLNTQR